jgi:adenylate cyclase
VPALAANFGRPIWSDLAWFKQDGALPETRRRVVVTVQRALTGADGAFAGVARAALSTRNLDGIMNLKPGGKDDPHRILLCDATGRLITRVTDTDRLRLVGDDLRYDSPAPPPGVRELLGHPELSGLRGGDTSSLRTIRFSAGGVDHLATFVPLAKSQEWIVAIVVAEAHYLGELAKARRDLLVAALLVIGCVLAGGVLTLRMVQDDLARVVGVTGRVQDLDFVPVAPEARLRDVLAVMDGLEQAKTALRAMGKYVPIALVRQLYRDRSEPALGGELQHVTLMFTDIEKFTTIAEGIEPGELARGLGFYLQAMAQCIHAREGVIDKYIGDAVMAIWNAPAAVDGHPVKACLAALDCVRATGRLFASASWSGLPALRTRFGLHSDRVLVGHFGAPDRMNFTALGDGVNLASRLEGLNKQYGTGIIASETVHAAARSQLAFRLLDRVAVKGKSRSIHVYELLDPECDGDAKLSAGRRYEEAFAAYLARDFAGALRILAEHPDDPPGRVLAERCKRLIAEPPPDAWDGVYVAVSK